MADPPTVDRIRSATFDRRGELAAAFDAHSSFAGLIDMANFTQYPIRLASTGLRGELATAFGASCAFAFSVLQK